MVKALGGVRMIFNFKDDPTLKEDINKLKNDVSQQKSDMSNFQTDFNNAKLNISRIVEKLAACESSLSDLSYQVSDLNNRVDNMSKWKYIGSYSSGHKGQYITPSVALSECNEIMLMLYYNTMIIGSVTVSIDTFKNYPIKASVRDGSTTRFATIQYSSDGRIYIHDVADVSYAYIYVR